MEIRRGKPTRELRQIGNLVEHSRFDNPQRGRVYDINGIAPSIDTMGGGNREIKVFIEYGSPIKF